MQVNEWKKYPATYLLLGLTTLTFICQYLLNGFQATSPLSLFKMGAMYGAFVQYSPLNLWRLVTPIFVHIGVEHFLFNMLTLYFMGKMAEQIFGTPRFLGLYLLAGVMGNAFTLLFTPNVIAAGASTSLFGLFAAVVILGYYSHSPLLNQLGRNYLALIVIIMKEGVNFNWDAENNIYFPLAIGCGRDGSKVLSRKKYCLISLMQ